MSGRIVPAASGIDPVSVTTTHTGSPVLRQLPVVSDGGGSVPNVAAAPTYLTLAEVADRVGVKPESMRTYHQRAERGRRDGTSRPGDLPPPDRRYGPTPVWKASTIRTWLAHRPGRGAGGGRPKQGERA